MNFKLLSIPFFHIGLWQMTVSAAVRGLGFDSCRKFTIFDIRNF